MKTIAIKTGFGFWLVLITIACSDRLDLVPISSISDGNFWQTTEQTEAFVAGVHTRFRDNTLQFIYLGEMRADIFGTDEGSNSAFTGEATQGVERTWLNNLDMDNPGVGNFGGFYGNINQINLLIDKMNTSDQIAAADRDKYLGMAYGLRAFYYFQMLRSWGDVILQTAPTTSINVSELARPAASQEEVMDLIKSDISHSEASFGDNYSFQNRRAYWSKAATLMLKAEVYLWTSYRGGGTADAAIAKEALTEIQTNVPQLSLLPEFASVFSPERKGNDEIIFAVRYQLNEASLPIAGTFMPQTSLIVNFYDSLENRQFSANLENYGGLLRSPVKISTFRKFDDADTRKWATIQPAYNKVNNTYEIAGAFVIKYEGEQDAGIRHYTNDFPVYRYADLLLLLAEAKAVLGEDPSPEINQVRQRAYADAYREAEHGYPHMSTDGDAQEAILRERLFEFVFEGKRWYDLRRMGDEYVYEHTTVLPSESYKLLWPIDRNTLTNNRALKQNPGYPQF